jgi:hypothetical protein
MENGKTWPMAETIPSYLCARAGCAGGARSWRVAIRRGFRKTWAVWDQEKTASLLYPVGRDGEWEDMAETILSYLLAELVVLVSLVLRSV